MIEALLIGLIIVLCIISGYSQTKWKNLIDHSQLEHILYLRSTRIKYFVVSIVGAIMFVISFFIFAFGNTRETVHINKGWFRSEQDIEKWTSTGNWAWALLIIGAFIFVYCLIRACRRDISLRKYCKMSENEYYNRQLEAARDLEKEEKSIMKANMRMFKANMNRWS